MFHEGAAVLTSADALQQYVRWLINFKQSVLGNLDTFTQMQQQLDAGENVILLANHQTEADPGAVPSVILSIASAPPRRCPTSLETENKAWLGCCAALQQHSLTVRPERLPAGLVRQLKSSSVLRVL